MEVPSGMRMMSLPNLVMELDASRDVGMESMAWIIKTLDAGDATTGLAQIARAACCCDHCYPLPDQ